jgi:hemerythrin-like domain-containing protein
MLMHQAIRKDLDRMAEVSAMFDASDPAVRARFGRWVELLWMMVEHHHKNEDETMFPTLKELDPTFECTGLEEEHQELYGQFDLVREHLAALADAADVETAKTELADSVVAMRDHMVSHLDREEAACVERIDRLVGPEETKRLEREGGRRTPFRVMTKMVPWMMSAASDEDRVAIRQRLPFLFRWLNDLFWQPSYDRRASWVRD